MQCEEGICELGSENGMRETRRLPCPLTMQFLHGSFAAVRSHLHFAFLQLSHARYIIVRRVKEIRGCGQRWEDAGGGMDGGRD